ncbi:MAG: transposase [Candidatus Omnitrophica bacterium]|nr:transposase [Candidatus Omnitrophota bacterium]
MAIIHSYVLMDNHYHLILETPRANLSRIMHCLNTSYAVYFNATRKRAGPLYQGRFKATLVQEDRYLHYLSCYIHLNPVRAGIVKSPEAYPYSSYSFFIFKKAPPKWLNADLVLSMFDKNTSRARQLYRQFVMDSIGKEKDIIKSNTRNEIVLGDEDFFQTIKEKIVNRAEDPEIPALKNIKQGFEPTLSHIKNTVEGHVKDSKRDARSLSVYFSRKCTQKTLNEIAMFFGKMQYTGVSQVWRRVERRRREERKLEALITRLEAEIMKCQM